MSAKFRKPFRPTDLDAPRREDGGLASEKTLRDDFAGLAMAAYLISPETATETTNNPSHCAEWAYMQADQMLKARTKESV